MIRNKIKKMVLLLSDLLSAYIALIITLAIRYDTHLIKEKMASHLPKFIFVFITWILALYINNLYNLNIKNWSKVFLKNLISAFFFSAFLSIIYFYLTTDNQITPKTNLLLFFLIASTLLVIWRQLFSLIVKNIISQENLAIIGLNEKTNTLLSELKKNTGLGYGSVLIFKNIDELKFLTEKIKEKNIKNIIICDNFNNEDLLQKTLFKCLDLELSFFSYSDFYEHLSGKIPLEAINNSWFLENIKEAEKNYFNYIKNVFDFTISIAILILTLPFWPLIALIIKLESNGPVFIKQNRLGKNEKEFRIIKFRTMRELDNNQKPTEEKDKRITSFGSFLRKTRIDEIPQVLNIIKGEMSFIGPRPERPEIASELEKNVPFYKTRLIIKPGISGWDQVSGEYHSPSKEDTIKKLQNDLFYIKNRSLYLDLVIILKTISTTISAKGR